MLPLVFSKHLWRNNFPFLLEEQIACINKPLEVEGPWF